MSRPQREPREAVPRVRRATDHDLRSVFEVYQRSLYAYLHRIGLVDEATAGEPPIGSAWPREGPWIEHLWRTAGENWVAVDDTDKPVGWALSTERDGVLELTHLFVQPGVQARGVGRALIEHAFPADRGRHRVILATQDARALGLYLRTGVALRTVAARFELEPRPIADAATDLDVEPLAPDDDAVELVTTVEQALIGHRRDPDIRFLLGMRPAWVARRKGTVVGFAFGAQPRAGGDDTPGHHSGPMAALDEADVPALIDHVLNEAAMAGVEHLYVSTPFANHVAVGHLLSRGARIDPFYIMVLGDDQSMRLDRWIHTGPFFII